MRDSIDWGRLAALDEIAHRGVSTSREAPIAAHCRRSAVDDAIRADRTVSREAIEAWERHAQAANGFGELTPVDSPASGQPANHEAHVATRTLRSRVLGGIVVAIRKVDVIVRRALARHRQRRQIRADYGALRELDDRTLRDLGFHRSEILSVATEVAGAVERTRVRALPISRELPI